MGLPASIVTIGRAAALAIGQFGVTSLAGAGRMGFFPIAAFAATPNPAIAFPRIAHWA